MRLLETAFFVLWKHFHWQCLITEPLKRSRNFSNDTQLGRALETFSKLLGVVCSNCEAIGWVMNTMRATACVSCWIRGRQLIHVNWLIEVRFFVTRLRRSSRPELCSPSQSAVAQHQSWLTVSHGSTSVVTHRQTMLTVSVGSPSAMTHQYSWLTISHCSPWAMAHSQPWLTVSHGSLSAVAHHRPWLTASHDTILCVQNSNICWHLTCWQLREMVTKIATTTKRWVKVFETESPMPWRNTYEIASLKQLECYKNEQAISTMKILAATQTTRILSPSISRMWEDVHLMLHALNF